jgi:hypothetical protein
MKYLFPSAFVAKEILFLSADVSSFLLTEMKHVSGIPEALSIDHMG